MGHPLKWDRRRFFKVQKNPLKWDTHLGGTARRKKSGSGHFGGNLQKKRMKIEQTNKKKRNAKAIHTNSREQFLGPKAKIFLRYFLLLIDR